MLKKMKLRKQIKNGYILNSLKTLKRHKTHLFICSFMYISDTAETEHTFTLVITLVNKTFCRINALLLTRHF